MKNDLDAAARIQKSLLPDSAPENAALDCAWVFRPCDELAGDIFDIFLLDDEHVGFYLLDVAGHGVEAALLSVTLSRILSPSVGHGSVLFSQNRDGSHLRTPSEIVLELNQRFQVREDHEKFFTILFGSLDLNSRELRYVSAGNPWPILVANRESPQLIDVSGLPVGISEEPGYVDEVMFMEPGDRLFLYSDGVLDARNLQGKAFGWDNLLKCVDGSGDPLSSTVMTIEEEALRWCDGQPQDDISVLAIKINTE